MKIALLTDGIFPYVIGGMQKHSFLLAKYLAKNEVSVDLYHFNDSALDITKLELFSDQEKKFIKSIVLSFPKKGNLPGHYIRESYEYSIRVFNEFMKNAEVDFIYAKGFSGWKLMDEKRKGLSCAPVGVNLHGLEMFQVAPTFKSKIEQLLLLKNPALFNLTHANYVFSYGGKITDLMLKLGVDSKKIIEIPAGIEENWVVDEPSKSSTPLKFVFVGRYERRKGIEELNSALTSLINKHNFEFHFIGTIPVKKQVVSPKIIYHGSIVETEKMKLLLSSFDVLVCPSHSEGMPNVILEGMASGLAIIATEVGAIPVMVSETNGILLKAPDFENIISAIERMIALPEEEIVQLKKHSIQKVKEKFLWTEIVKQTILKLEQSSVKSKSSLN